MDTPANQMTPLLFAEAAKENLVPLGVKVEARDRKWAESMKMGSFLSVARGSNEPPVFLEISYCGGPKGNSILPIRVKPENRERRVLLIFW